jgi:hypothetical protein
MSLHWTQLTQRLKRSVISKNSGSNPSTAAAPEGPSRSEEITLSVSKNLPDRYSIKQQGEIRILTCLEAPNINVHVNYGSVATVSAAQKAPPGTIYLDGAAQGKPFLNHEQHIYNLDHHEGCVRPFTLSTCEQALVIVMKGLDLRNREWNIYANDPDLDTVLAIWILLNHLRVNEKETLLRRTLLPLVRLEGAIDALGLELKEVCALPPDLMQKTQRKIDNLRKEETALKKERRWEKIDHLDYTASILRKIDRMVYQPRDFADFIGVEELARQDLTENRFAIVVQADMGIYELEPHLHKLYGKGLGLAILKRNPNAYTLRQIDSFIPGSLEEVYERLNFMDPAVKLNHQNNRWGGAADIGGSPRLTGTKLTPHQILKACQDAYQKFSFLHHVYRFLLTAIGLAAILTAGKLVESNWKPVDWLGPKYIDHLIRNPVFGFTFTLTILTFSALAFFCRNKIRRYGLRIPYGKDWWLILPIALLGGFFGGVWFPKTVFQQTFQLEDLFFIIFAVPLSAEMLFRSLLHGMLAKGTKTQYSGGRWFISWPIAATAILYAGATALLFSNHDTLWQLTWPHWKTWQTLCGAFIFALAAGVARERSHSFLSAYLFSIITTSAVAFTSTHLV